jgi:hypothetical protein
MKKIWTIFLAAMFFAASPALAQDDSQAAPPPDAQSSPPVNPQSGQPADVVQQANSQPGMARISVIQGNVSTERGDNGEWNAATVNTPVAPGDRVSTGNDSRAEVQLDGSNVVRLSSNASAKVATLARNQIQIQVDEGLITYSILRGSDAAVEIDTPNVAIRPRGEGQFRIQVNNAAETRMIVRYGSADVATQQGSTTITEGQTITVAGTDNPQYQISNAPARDEWDTWNNDRNQVILNAQSWRNTNRNYTGSEDLDGYGHWQNVPDYGSVWVPSVGPGWAPYRAGRWVWEPYYGWTWVSYEPWGWAPYHYGRWFVYGGNWVWWPGPVGVYPAYYPVWAPAYVGFFGWGGGGWGFGVGFGFGWGWGHVGWLPIGPCDWYHPWYGHWGVGYHATSFASIHNTTAINNGFAPIARGGVHPYSNIGGLHNDMRLREGFTSMEGRDFGRSAVPGHQAGIDEATLRQASLVSGRMPIEPTRASYSASGRAANASTIHNSPARMFNSSMAPHTTLATRSNFSSGSRGQNMNAQTHSFTPPSSNRAAGANSSDRSFSSESSRMYGAPSARSNWHPFTPPSNAGRVEGAQSYSAPSQNGHEFQSPSSNYNRPQASSGYAYRAPGNPQFHSPASNLRGSASNSYRPPLNLHQPVVRPRGSSSGYSVPGNHGGGGYRPPSSGGNHGGGGGFHGGGGGSHGGRGH